MALYKSGYPQITTAAHAGSTGIAVFVSKSIKLAARKTPPAIVIFRPERKSYSLSNIFQPLILVFYFPGEKQHYCLLRAFINTAITEYTVVFIYDIPIFAF